MVRAFQTLACTTVLAHNVSTRHSHTRKHRHFASLHSNSRLDQIFCDWTPHKNDETGKSTFESKLSIPLSSASVDEILLTELIADDSNMAIRFSECKFLTL